MKAEGLRAESVVKMMRVVGIVVCVLACFAVVLAQGVAQTQDKVQTVQTSPQTPQKSNARPIASPTPTPDPFEGASVEKMAGQCVTLETEKGAIVIEFFPESAPATVRNFLNLVATGALDTTTFSRVVKDFVVQGGNLSTSEKWNLELARRMAHKIPDEPNNIKHTRGIVSMARPEEPNSASTHFFILMNDAPQLDGKFSAFGRVTQGMDVVEAINRAPAEGEKPEKPVRITRAVIATCAK